MRIMANTTEKLWELRRARAKLAVRILVTKDKLCHARAIGKAKDVYVLIVHLSALKEEYADLSERIEKARRR